jgi:acyl-coenzyme A synthetase/AMP-(fatty) acid ligase
LQAHWKFAFVAESAKNLEGLGLTMASGVTITRQEPVSEITASVASEYGRIATGNQRFPAIIRDDQVITHGLFWAIVKSFAVHLHDQGVETGSLIALNTKDMLPSLATLFATSLLGARLVIASKTLARAKVLQPTHFFRTPEVTGAKRVDFRVIDDSWMPTANAPPQEPDLSVPASPDADWLFLHTSGTTGRAKYIALSERIIRNRTEAVSKDFPFQRTTLATTFGFTSRPFFARAIATLLNAGAIMDSRDFALWTKAGVNFVCGSPLQVAKFLEGVSFRPRIKRIEVSGAKLPDDVAANLLDNFELVVDVYGAAETNKTFENVVMRGPEGGIIRKGQKLDSEIEIITANGRRCEAGEVGSVRVRNGYMVRGYLQIPEATAKSFRDGWFYPGDIATWGERGDLLVIGREDDVINLGGYKLNAGMIDMLFCSVPGIRDAISFHNPKPHAVDKILVFVVFEKDAEKANVIEAACQLAKTKLRLSLGTRAVMGIHAIPRTENETPDRKACQRLVLARAELA